MSWMLSARKRSSPWSRLLTSVRYRNAVATMTRAKAEQAYHTLNRVASDHERNRAVRCGVVALELRTGLEHIANPSNGVEQFRAKRLVDLRAKPTDVHIHHTRIALEVHIPHVFSDQRS